jgi:carbonic anhydrase
MTALAEGKPRERRLVELNVVESCLNLFKTPTVQKKRVDTYMNPDFPFTLPRIHALVFDPSVAPLPPP